MGIVNDPIPRFELAFWRSVRLTFSCFPFLSTVLCSSSSCGLRLNAHREQSARKKQRRKAILFLAAKLTRFNFRSSILRTSGRTDKASSSRRHGGQRGRDAETLTCFCVEAFRPNGAGRSRGAFKSVRLPEGTIRNVTLSRSLGLCSERTPGVSARCLPRYFSPRLTHGDNLFSACGVNGDA